MSKPAVRPKCYMAPTKICPICLGTFMPRRKSHKYCDECGKNRRYDIELYRNSKLRPISINSNKAIHARIAEIEAYNRKHGTCLTYGKYAQLENAGWLED